MSTRIRLLGIAPYENMQSLMQSVAEDYPDIDLTVFVGDLQQGVEMALRNFHNDYDAIISRGGTATLLRERLDLPVVEIRITAFDVMRAMKLAEHVSEHYAVVGFPNIIESAQNLCQLMELPIDTYAVHSAREAMETLSQLKTQGTQTILCDNIAYTTARQMGMDVLLITSSADGIRDAYDEVLRMYENQHRLQEENRFLRKLVWNQVHHTVVFNDDGELFFSTLADNNVPILEFLRGESFRGEPEARNILKQIKNVVYSIRLRYETFGGVEYAAFYFTESRVSSPDVRRGIRYVSEQEARKQFEESIYSVVNLIRDLQPQVQKLNRSRQPIMVCGEDGTLKESVVSYLHLTGPRRNHPLIIIDCFLLNEKSWNYLLDHHNSPLTQNECTIFVKNVDILSVQRRHQLLASLLETEVGKRNSLIFSCVCSKEREITEAGMDIMEKLACLNLSVPPLRQRRAQFGAILNLYLSHLNIDLEHQIIGLSPEAREILEHYDWPHNYTQFERVLKELTVAAQEPYIAAKEVRNVLSREQNMAIRNDRVDDQGTPLDLRMTMNELNKEIVRRVLAEEGGNQTQTAQRLGIGRTTLWRLLNNL